MGEPTVKNCAHRFNPAAADEEYVYGACSPSWHSAAGHETAVRKWIEFMQDEGIERVCCLLTGQQLDADDANIGLYRDAFGASNVKHAPIADHRLADADRLETEILPFLDAAVAKEQPVVVHSLAGIGRTGQVLAAWLIYGREYDPQAAIDTVVKMGRDPTEAVTHGNATEQELFDLLGQFDD